MPSIKKFSNNTLLFVVRSESEPAHEPVKTKGKKGGKKK